MKLPLTVDGRDVVVQFTATPDGSADDAGAPSASSPPARSSSPSGSSSTVRVGDLAAAVARGPVVGAAITVGGRPVALAQPLAAAGLRPGDDVEVQRHALVPAEVAGLAVHVVAGVDAGRTIPFPPPTVDDTGIARSSVAVGRGSSAHVQLASPAISKHHCTITVADGVVSVTDAGSRNGTVIDGERLGSAPVVVATGDPIRCGPAVLVVRAAAEPDTPRSVAELLATAPTGPVPFYRSPVDLAAPPGDPIAVPAPPRRPRTGKPGMIGMLLPAVFAAVMVKITGQLMYAMFALMTPMMMSVQLLDRAGRNRRVRRKSRRRFRQEVVEFAEELDEGVAYELRRRRSMHPDLAELVRRCATGGAALWDRRRDHPQFLHVALGVADVEWDPPLSDLSPEAADLPEVAPLLEGAETLPVAPLVVAVPPGTTIGLAGERTSVLAATRGVLLQVAAHHGPAEVRIVLVTSRTTAPDWEWLKWLPHVRPSSFSEGRLLAVVADERGFVDGGALDDVVADADAGSALFVVIDTAGLADAGDLAVRRLLRRENAPAAGVVLATSADGLPEMCEVVVVHHEAVGEAVCRWPREGGKSVEFVVGGVAPAVALRAARGLARFSDPDAGGGSASLPARIGQAAVLDLEGASGPDIVGRWASASHVAPVVGLSESGPVAVDLETSGPHLAVIGGRGSGKTEHLLGVILSIAASQPPERVHFILWGESFGLVHRLPHVASMVNRVDENNATVVVDGLERELTRRERLRTKGTPLAAEARLVVVIDDVDTIARLVPQTVDDLVRLARRGRGVGVHLIWSASKLMGGIIGELVDLSSSRIALRVGSPQESDELLGTDAAARLERSLPGRAYVAAGSSEAREVQGGAVSTGAPARHEGLEVSPFSLTTGRGGSGPRLGPPDERSLVALLVAAGAMSPRPPDILSPAAAAVSAVESPGLLELLGLEADGALDRVTETWQVTDTETFLRVPIGVDLDLRPVVVDLKESALAGMGPHGLLVGATGSGKSELLRTLVSGLAVSHSPEMLAFVLVDFKGGASFASFGRLPHVAGVVTNLADDLALVDRILAALGGEQRRRQELLAAAGNLGNVREYRAAYRAGKLPPELKNMPLPQLLVIVDEFAELLDSQPEFIDFFLTIGRVGRSLGIHLLLASQRLEEGKLRGLDTYLSYRLGLRTFSAMESRTVLGVPDAYSLPSAPGGGYLKVGNSSFDRFQASYVSGTIGAGAGDGSEGEGEEAAPLAGPPERAEGGSAGFDENDGNEHDDEVGAPTVMSTIVDHLERAADRVHQIWLPPLGDAIPLDVLFAPAGFVHDTKRGFAAARWPGTAQLAVPVGVVDEPELQRQLPLVLDFAGANGSLVIIGSPQTGKSLLLRTMVLALAVTHTPEEVQVYAIDLGGGTLEGVVGLPHVGTVANSLEPDLVSRIVGHVESVMMKREEMFRDRGIDSAATFRQLRADGELGPEDGGDIFLLIDGWGAFKERFEHLEPTIADLASRGLGFGVHVVITGTRYLEIRSNVLEAIGGRLELRMNSPIDSNVDRRKAGVIRSDQPGRGLHPSKRFFQVALPRLDGADTLHQLQAATSLAVEHIASRWDGGGAAKVRLLPNHLTVDEVLAHETAAPPSARGVVVGLQEAGMRPWRLDLGADPHFLVFGDGESGKTTFLQTWLTGLVASTSRTETRIVLVDYRRTLLDIVPSDYLHGYAASEPALQALLLDVVATAESRLPGADVTPAQLRDRSWWSGPELYVVVDDYDLTLTGSGSPLQPLVPLLAQARDVGLHLVLTRRVGGASKTMFEPVSSRLRDLGSSGLILSGPREEGALVGAVRASQQPPGRGTLVTRRDAPTLVQIAVLADQPDQPDQPDGNGDIVGTDTDPSSDKQAAHSDEPDGAEIADR